MGKKNTSTSTYTPNAAASGTYQDILSRANAVSNQPYNPYGGQMVADFSPMQQNVFGNIGANFDASKGYMDTAAQFANTAASPITSGQIQNYMNPYQQSVIDATMGNIREQEGQDRQALIGNAIQSGAWGGDRAGVAQAEQMRKQELARNSTMAGLNAQNYQQALGAAQQDAARAGQGAFTFANLGTAAQNAALGAGGMQQQQEQAKIAADYNQYLQQIAFPYQQLSFLSGIATPVGGAMGGTTTNTSPGPSAISQALGLATAGLGFMGGMPGTMNPFMSLGSGTNQQLQQSASAYPNYASTFGVIPNMNAWRFADGGAVKGNNDFMETVNSIRKGLRNYAAGGSTPTAGADEFDMDSAFSAFRPKNPMEQVAPYYASQIPSQLPIPTPQISSNPIPPPMAPELQDQIPENAVEAEGRSPFQMGQPQEGGISPEASQGLIAAGLGMMAGTSPFAGVNIGAGGLKGLESYAQAKRLNMAEQREGRKDELEREAIRLRAQQVAAQLKAITEGKMPQGYRSSPSGDLEHIPGGPADPQQIERINRAKGEARPLTAAEQRQVIKAEETAESAEGAVGALKQALELNKKAYDGPLAKVRGYASATTGWDKESGNATLELDNLITGNALTQLRSIFGGNPTEGERKVLLDVAGSVDQPTEVRQRIFERALKAAEKRMESNKKAAEQIKNKEYFAPTKPTSSAPKFGPEHEGKTGTFPDGRRAIVRNGKLEPIE